MRDQFIEAVLAVFPAWSPGDDLTSVRFQDITGWDSMNGINLQMEVESRFGVDLSERPIQRDETLQAFLDYLSGALSR